MLVVITGLDGSGTSSIAEGLNKIDPNSKIFKTPGPEYSDRKQIDQIIRENSKTAHMLYYLSSVVYISDYIKNNCDYKNNNIYVIRYLIDTVVSNRVAGIPIDLNYNIYGNELIKPDLTLFVGLEEQERKKRIENRGKDVLDKVLDDEEKRTKFLNEFKNLLEPEKTIFINNNDNIETVVKETYQKIKEYENTYSKQINDFSKKI